MSGTPDIVMAGNLTADPELRFTPSGQAVANFTVACTERILDKQTNEWRDGDTTFIRCSVWRQLAENVAETLTKGMRVIVTGRLKVRQYETREGGKGTSVECDVTEVGPSLKNASAKVMRTTRWNQGQGGQGGQQQDPWSTGGQDPWSAGGQDPWGPPPQPQQRQQQWAQQQQPQGPPQQQPQHQPQQQQPSQQQLPSQQGHSQQQAWGNTPAANSPWGNQPPTPDEAPF